MSRAEEIKQEIFEKAVEYYRLVHDKSAEPFVPGQSRVNYAGRVFDEKEILGLLDASLEFWLTNGRFSAKFEALFAGFLGVKAALLVNSGSSANLLAFMSLTSPLLKDRRVCRGDEVITVAAGFPTTIAPLVQYGAVPVFVDINPRTCNIDATLLQEALSSKTKAVMIAHTLGNPFNVKAVQEFCDQHDLWLIEDNCDALGSRYNGQYTGTFGDIGTSSFYPPHHMTMGEGGAVYTNSVLLRKILLSLRDWGRDCWCDSGKDNTCQQRFTQQFSRLPYGYDHKYVYGHFGYNLKATDLQAAIGCAQIEKLIEFTQKRQDNFNHFYNGLKDLSDIFWLPQATPNSQPSWFGFLMTVKDGASFTRNDIVLFLERNNIQTRNLFAGNVTFQPCFDVLEEGRDYRVVGELLHTNKIMNNSFWWGVYPGIRREAVDYIIEKIREFVKR